jgi:uncharacterized protein (UPF0303 family)
VTDEDLTATIARLEQEERELVLPAFSYDEAWRLGSLIYGKAVERGLGVAIDIHLGDQQVFHAARPGSVPDNDSWLERKGRVVRRFGSSSYLVGLRHEARGTTFEAATQLRLQEYAAHGGAFPIRVGGVGIVGVAAVSGLKGSEDHALVVEALRELLAG